MTEPAERTPEPSDAILTIPNLITFFRLGLVIPFLYFALGPDRMDIAFGIAAFALATDLVDGRIARRYGQISKLGVALDPLSDRLGLAAGAVVLIVHDLAPLWAVLGVLGRDVLLLVVGVPILKARNIAIPPVSKVGKYGSFWVSMSFGLFLASGIPRVNDPNDAVRWAAWAFYVLGVPTYWAAGLGYIKAGLTGLRGNRG
jgi:cardiolipin synthase